MPLDDSKLTSKETPSLPQPWSVEGYWAEQMKPSRQRNLSPQERRRLAILLRSFRREWWAEEKLENSR